MKPLLQFSSRPDPTPSRTPCWLNAALLLLSLALSLKAETGGEPQTAREPERHRGAQVVPPDQLVFGRSYGAWGGEWWKWVLSTPADQNPIGDPTGALGGRNQHGPVWFLDGTFGGSVERTVTIPAGKGVFFPLFNYFNDYPCPDPAFHPAPGQTLEAFLRQGAAAFVDAATDLAVQVDGAEIPRPFDYRAASGLVTFTANPTWASLDPCVVPGVPQQGVADGYWIMLAPLSRGEHTIHFLATGFAGGFHLDVTYHVTVAGGDR
ncbi:MAG TPA: hypothetical protein DCM86_10330 [Verrucomicrobiales bacterium]|nr:hypothetical protein [Verrucomicrobiales bacterium]